MKIRFFILLGIISMTLLLGCESDWYPIFEDWLCTINIDGTDLEYIRSSFGNFLLSPDRQTLIEYTKNKFYSVSLNDLSSRILILDYGDDADGIKYPTLSNTYIAFWHHKDIYTLDLETYNVNKLTDSGNNRYPAISNDESKIAYTCLNDSFSTIYVMDSDGSNNNKIFEIENIGLEIKIY